MALEVEACVATVNVGLNGRYPQPPTWNGAEGEASAPARLVSVEVRLSGAQLVGLNVNPGRSSVTVTPRSWIGMPSRIVGSGSLCTLMLPSLLTWIPTRTVTLPRSYGPATAGTTTDRENG